MPEKYGTSQDVKWVALMLEMLLLQYEAYFFNKG